MGLRRFLHANGWQKPKKYVVIFILQTLITVLEKFLWTLFPYMRKMFS